MKLSILQKIRVGQTRLLEWLVRVNPGLGLGRRAELFVSFFDTEIPKNALILDVGGRWGFYAGPLIKRGHFPVILDVVRPGLQHAPVVIYDGARMPFPDQSFDVSLLVTVLHHIDGIDQVFQEVRRVTRSKVIVVEDLYHHCCGRFWTILRDRFFNCEWFGHPCNFKTRVEWQAYFEKQGFQVVSIQEVVTKLCGLDILNGIFILERKT